MPEQVYEFLVTEAEARIRLDEFLSRRLPFLSQRQIRRLCHSGAVEVAQRTPLRGYRLLADAHVVVRHPEDAFNFVTPEDLPIAVVYEEDSFLVVNKPAGILVHPTPGVRTGTLLNGLAHYLNRGRTWANWIRPGLAHRLDRETSGLLVVAKTPGALQTITRHFAERRVRKHYLALVHGTVSDDEIFIDVPLGRDVNAQPHWGVRDSGRAAQTRLRVCQRLGIHTFVSLEPLTGRTNQLRIHCAHIGHPIVGDMLYGPSFPAGPRLCLHAAQLAFHHPDTGAWLEFSAPWPDGME